MKLLIFGNKGQLGRELSLLCESQGFDCDGYDLPELDITDGSLVKDTVAAAHPALVVNAAAYTAVDKAETEKDIAFAINQKGPSYLADACIQNDIPLIHISTDYVFDGTRTAPYTERDEINPLNTYGASKAAGEKEVSVRLDKHIIIRTSWLYGIHGHNFVKVIIAKAMKEQTLTVVDDQFGCPTHARDLAEVILLIVSRYAHDGVIPWGTYHFCNEGVTSWHGFAKEIVQIASTYATLKTEHIRPIKTKDYPTAAKRPLCSVLDCRRISDAFGITQKPWRKSLAEMIERMHHANVLH